MLISSVIRRLVAAKAESRSARNWDLIGTAKGAATHTLFLNIRPDKPINLLGV